MLAFDAPKSKKLDDSDAKDTDETLQNQGSWLSQVARVHASSNATYIKRPKTATRTLANELQKVKDAKSAKSEHEIALEKRSARIDKLNLAKERAARARIRQTEKKRRVAEYGDLGIYASQLASGVACPKLVSACPALLPITRRDKLAESGSLPTADMLDTHESALKTSKKARDERHEQTRIQAEAALKARCGEYHARALAVYRQYIDEHGIDDLEMRATLWTLVGTPDPTVCKDSAPLEIHKDVSTMSKPFAHSSPLPLSHPTHVTIEALARMDNSTRRTINSDTFGHTVLRLRIAYQTEMKHAMDTLGSQFQEIRRRSHTLRDEAETAQNREATIAESEISVANWRRTARDAYERAVAFVRSSMSIAASRVVQRFVHEQSSYRVDAGSLTHAVRQICQLPVKDHVEPAVYITLASLAAAGNFEPIYTVCMDQQELGFRANTGSYSLLVLDKVFSKALHQERSSRIPPELLTPIVSPPLSSCVERAPVYEFSQTSPNTHQAAEPVVYETLPSQPQADDMNIDEDADVDDKPQPRDTATFEDEPAHTVSHGPVPIEKKSVCKGQVELGYKNSACTPICMAVGIRALMWHVSKTKRSTLSFDVTLAGFDFSRAVEMGNDVWLNWMGGDASRGENMMFCTEAYNSETFRKYRKYAKITVTEYGGHVNSLDKSQHAENVDHSLSVGLHSNAVCGLSSCKATATVITSRLTTLLVLCSRERFYLFDSHGIESTISTFLSIEGVIGTLTRRFDSVGAIYSALTMKL